MFPSRLVINLSFELFLSLQNKKQGLLKQADVHDIAYTSFILGQEVTVCMVYYQETLSAKGPRLTLKKCLVLGLAIFPVL